jgi:hypothetical protein
MRIDRKCVFILLLIQYNIALDSWLTAVIEHTFRRTEAMGKHGTHTQKVFIVLRW